MAINGNGRFIYPKESWSQGKMKKVGQRPGETQVAMMLRRKGEPELGGWTPEAERLAGAGIGGRGGTRAAVSRGAKGVSPETIQGMKAQTGARLGGAWEGGTLAKVRKTEQSRRRNLEQVSGMNADDVIAAFTAPIAEITGRSVPEIKQAAGEFILQKKFDNAQRAGQTTIQGFNEKGEVQTLPIGDFDVKDQARRFTEMVSLFSRSRRAPEGKIAKPEGGFQWSDNMEE